MKPRGRVPAFSDDIRQRLYAEVFCFYLIFRFHDYNNHLRKAVTLMVVFVWGTLEVLRALEIGTMPESMSWLRLFVGVLLARMWNIELDSFASAAVDANRSSPDDDTDTDTSDDGDG